MNTIRFFIGNFAPAYSCNKPNDNSGNYVEERDALRLLRTVKDVALILSDIDPQPEGAIDDEIAKEQNAAVARCHVLAQQCLRAVGE